MPGETAESALVSPREAGRATVVVAARTEESAALSGIVRELLENRGVSCQFSETTRLEPRTLLANDGESPGVLVLIQVETALARLYFRGPFGERFLLRRLALPRGLDQVGLELVAQVVESSTLALLHSSEGLNRAEVSAELAREVSRPAHREPPSLSEPTPARRSSLELGVAARYAVLWSGPDLGAQHGPGAELGVGYRTKVLLRVQASAERWFSQSLETPELEARLDTTALRFGLSAGAPLSDTRHLVLAVAAGADVVRVEPGRASATDVELTAAETRLVPALRFELRYEHRLPPARIALGAVLDASLVDTHYDLAESAGLRRIAEPWVTRPGALVALGLDL